MAESLDNSVLVNSYKGSRVYLIVPFLIPSIPVVFGILEFFDIVFWLLRYLLFVQIFLFCHFSHLIIFTMLKEKPFTNIGYTAVEIETISKHDFSEIKKFKEKVKPCISIFFGVTVTTFKIGIFFCVLLFVIFPIIFKYSYALQRSVVFLTFADVPINADYQHPEKYGLKGSRNFFIETDDDITLGAWQILPSNLLSHNETDDEFFEKILNDGQNVVIYNHGNGGTRMSAHRIEIYQVLRKYFHVVAFDYRSYGDSSKSPPSELGLVSDILNVYRWVRNRTNSNIFIWGHSLGTSLSTHSLLKIQSMQLEKPVGLILESPFNNMKEEISEFPLASLFAFLPWFRITVVEPMSENFVFETDKYICGIDVPIMILHAEDDRVVPFRLGHKLYETALQCRHDSQGRILFYAFGGENKFGHKYICRASDLPDKISNFIQLALETKNEKRF